MCNFKTLLFKHYFKLCVFVSLNLLSNKQQAKLELHTATEKLSIQGMPFH